MSSQTFDQFAIVELMGHQRIAGRLTEQVVGGSAFVRVDVPALPGVPAFTKLLGPSSIYAITIVDEETANAAARMISARPVTVFSARQMLGISNETFGPDPE